MTRLTRKVGYRVSKWILDDFNDLCGIEGIRSSQAIERFMELTIEKGSVESLLNAAVRGWSQMVRRNETTARLMISWLKNKRYWYPMDSGKNRSAIGRLVDLLETIQDQSLREEIVETLKKEV